MRNVVGREFAHTKRNTSSKVFGKISKKLEKILDKWNLVCYYIQALRTEAQRTE